LSQRIPRWRFDLPAECLDGELGPHWAENAKGIRCCSLPQDWLVDVNQRLEKRLKDVSRDPILFRALLRALARDLDFARDLDGFLDRDRPLEGALYRDRVRVLFTDLRRDLVRDLALDPNRDLDRSLNLVRDPNHALDLVGDRDTPYFFRSHDRFRSPSLVGAFALALARALNPVNAQVRFRYLEEVEVLSLLLISLMVTGSPQTAVFRDVYLASVIAQEQQAGNIQPNPTGIVCFKRRI